MSELIQIGKYQAVQIHLMDSNLGHYVMMEDIDLARPERGPDGGLALYKVKSASIRQIIAELERIAEALEAREAAE